MSVTASNSTCPWLDHSVSGFILETTFNILELNFFVPALFNLRKLATKINLLIYYTKDTLSLVIKSSNCLLALNFNVFSIFMNSFSPFLHSTNSLSSIKTFRLWGWYPNIQSTHNMHQFTFLNFQIFHLTGLSPSTAI